MRRFADVVRSILRQPGFAGLLATMFTLGLASSFVSPFLSMWGTLYVHMSPLRFGLFMTTTSFSAIVISLTLARWSDTHVARRTMLIVGPIGGMLGYTGYAFVRDPVALTVIGSLAIGVATVSFSQLFAFGREELGRPENAGADASLLMSLLRVFFSLAWMIGPALGAAVMAHFSYRGIFLAAAGLFFVFLLGILRFVPHRPHPPSRREAVREPLLRVITRPIIFAHSAGLMLVFAAYTMNLLNLPLLVTQQLGGDTRSVGIIFGIAPVIEMPLMIWFGRLAAQGKKIALMRFGVFVAIVYFLTLTLAKAPWHIYPMQILSAASIAVTTNIAITFFQDLLPGQFGVATSIYSNSYSIGALVGYFTFGLLLGQIGHRGIYFVCAGMCAVTFTIFMLYRHDREIAGPAAAAA